MMRKKVIVLLAVLVVSTAMIAACQNSITIPRNESVETESENNKESKDISAEAQTIDCEVKSVRDSNIKTTIVLPAKEPENGYPVVMMLHGTAGSRSENGKFDDLADVLADLGIASIRMDFPGCNQSEEDELLDTIGNRLNDSITCLDYFRNNYKLDESRICVLGYSLGTRVAPLVSEKEDINTMVLWGPCAQDMTEEDMSYGYPLKELIEMSKETGTCEILAFGQWPKSFSYEGLMDQINYKSGTALANYKGRVLFVTGGLDDVVTEEISDDVIASAVNATQVAQINVPRVGHLLGGQEMDAESHAAVVYGTAYYIYTNMMLENTLIGPIE